jgi:hypothetical protein
MTRVIVFFRVFAALWLAGFGMAAVTAGAAAAVVVGTMGLLGTIAAATARIGAQQPPTARRSGSATGRG